MMDTAIQIVASGMTLGAMYALSSISLALVWGSLSMLNMSQGAMLTVGGYAAFAAVSLLGLPVFLGIPAAMFVGGLLGLVIYLGMIKFMIDSPSFETSVIIATIGLAMILENIILQIFGAYPFAQPVMMSGGIRVGGVNLPYQNIAMIAASVAAMLATAWVIGHTRMGRAIRATAQNREAARLMGVPTRVVFAQVLMLTGVLSALSGVMLSSITTLSPTMGYDPMTKAFIICVIAGLGRTTGALYASFLLGLLEAVIQYTLGVRFALPLLLLFVILVLIWRPEGLFNRRKVVRL